MKFRNIINKNKKELIIVFIVLLIAAFLRLYNIRQFVIFLGDEGRDALVVKRMIVDHDFTLLGPTASVGGFYLGPVYYYFMIPFLWLFNFDPVGPAVMVALFGIATVGLLYLTVREWINKQTALISALLYATAPGIVSASRSSWNPNIMPFFALLMIFTFSFGAKKKKTLWFLIAGIAYGVAIQSHYLGLILGPILAISTLVIIEKKEWIKTIIFEIVGFLIGASMFLAFEMRHNFPNTRNIIEFVTRGKDVASLRSWNLLWLFFEMLRRTTESVMPNLEQLIKVILLLSLGGLILFLYQERNQKGKISITSKTIIVWLIVGVIGIGSYQGQLYPHYFGFLFPLPIILIAISVGTLLTSKKTKALAMLLTVVVTIFNIQSLNIWGQGSNLINQTTNVAQNISKITEGNEFNFALISVGNSDHAYRYFLEISGNKPLGIEEKVTEQLIVVCEEYGKPCEPLGHSLWEIAGFGRAEIVSQTVVEPGIIIIKLSHHADSIDLIGKPAPKG